jgi:hypothetical protein
MWKSQYKGQTGIHLRRIHYRLDAIGYPKVVGTAYTNCPADWALLNRAATSARHLIPDQVPPQSFEDHRNPEPHALDWSKIYSTPGDAIPRAYGGSALDWDMPQLNIEFIGGHWGIGQPSIRGYAPDDYVDRAYYIELWIEKSTMNDILVDVTEDLGVRLVTSVGTQSITNAWRLLERVAQMKRQTRIFYVSDCDEQGEAMPVSVARQIEYAFERVTPDGNIKLLPLALTPAQVKQYKLPTTDVEGKKKTELDALEARQPGLLEKLVREAIEPYIDFGLRKRLRKDYWLDLEQHKQTLSDAAKRGNQKRWHQSSGGESPGDRTDSDTDSLAAGGSLREQAEGGSTALRSSPSASLRSGVNGSHPPDDCEICGGTGFQIIAVENGNVARKCKCRTAKAS